MGCPLLAVCKLVVILIRVIGVETLAGRWEVSVLCLWRPSRNIAALTTPEVLTNKPQLRTLQPRGRIRSRNCDCGVSLGMIEDLNYLHLCGQRDQSLLYIGPIWEPIYYIGSGFPLRSGNIFFTSIGKFQF